MKSCKEFSQSKNRIQYKVGLNQESKTINSLVVIAAAAFIETDSQFHCITTILKKYSKKCNFLMFFKPCVVLSFNFQSAWRTCFVLTAALIPNGHFFSSSTHATYHSLSGFYLSQSFLIHALLILCIVLLDRWQTFASKVLKLLNTFVTLPLNRIKTLCDCCFSFCERETERGERENGNGNCLHSILLLFR